MDFNDRSKDSDLPETFNDASSAGDDARLERLKEALSKTVLGQQEVVDRIASTLLTAPIGAGKTDATLKAMARTGEKVTVVNLEDFKNGAMDVEKGRVFFIEEINRKSEQEIEDAVDVFLGRPTRQQRGEMAAEVCRNGMETPVTCMKPLRFRAGFVFS